MRTVRTADAGAVYAHPATQMARLERQGLLHKLATGYYVAVPQEHAGTDWRPTIEAAAAGIAAAAVGVGRVVLMGISAARMHNAIPRALAIAIVATPDDRRDIALRDRDGVVHFVRRDTDRLDAELVGTELGQCLVTTPEQTVLDLARRPDLGHAAIEAHAAIAALLPRCDERTLERLAREQRLRAALARVRPAAR
jgi:predicted transcriptional regulator of viral defense system